MEKVWLQHYEEGVPHEIDNPEKTFYEILEQNADEVPNNAAFSFFGKEINFSHETIWSSCGDWMYR